MDILKKSRTSSFLSKITDVRNKAHIQILTGTVSILVAIGGFILFRKIDNAKPTVQSLYEYNRSNLILGRIQSVFNGLLSIILGVLVLTTHIPSPNEISTAILVKHLRESNTVTPEFYNLLQHDKLKPYRIDEFFQS